MSKKIIVSNCLMCPYIMYGDGFSTPACVPYCSKAFDKIELPYTEEVSKSCFAIEAIPTGVIPDWCPLEDSGEQNEKD